MKYPRLNSIIEALTKPHVCLDFYEYRKARLIFRLLFNAWGDFTNRQFEEFMSQADVMEASIYERLRLEAARDFDIYPSEAWFRAETYRQMEKHLSNLPCFSAS